MFVVGVCCWDLVNYTDPFGLCPSCVGAVTNVAAGWAIAKLTGSDYTLKNAAVDAAAGAAGVGLASRLSKLRRLAGAVDDVVDDGLGVVYRRTNQKTGEVYIGRSKSEAAFGRRKSAHDRSLGVNHQYEVLDRAANGTPLRVLEESTIRRHGGPGKLANKRYEMNDEAYRGAGGTVPKP